jgi:hypothetical protein
MALLNRGLDAVAWGGAARPTVSATVAYGPPSSLKLALRGRDMEERTLKVGVPFLFTNQPPDPATGEGSNSFSMGWVRPSSDWVKTCGLRHGWPPAPGSWTRKPGR